MNKQTSGSFIVQQKAEGEELSSWLQEVFRRYTDYLTDNLPDRILGFYEVFKPTAAGDVTAVVKDFCRHTHITVVAAAGAGAYTWNLTLPESKKNHNKEGDRLTILFIAPSSTNPTIQIKNESGSVIATVTFNGTGNDYVIGEFVNYGDTWLLVG